MKKVIRLTEADLARIVKKVIKENEDEFHDELLPEVYMEYIDKVVNNVINLFETDLENGHINGTYDIDSYVNKMSYKLNKLFMDFMEEENLSDETINELDIYANDMVEDAVDYFYDTVEGRDFPEQFED